MFQVTHFIVNHFKTFKDPETGAYTNNCQGIHGVIKQDGRAESGPLRGLLEGLLDVNSLFFGGLRAHHPCLRRSWQEWRVRIWRETRRWGMVNPCWRGWQGWPKWWGLCCLSYERLLCLVVLNKSTIVLDIFPKTLIKWVRDDLKKNAKLELVPSVLTPPPLLPCWDIVFWESLRMSWSPPLPPCSWDIFLKSSFLLLNSPFRCFINFRIPKSLFFLFGNTLRLKFVHIWSSPCLYIYSLRCEEKARTVSTFMYMGEILNLTWINLACDLKSWGIHFQLSNYMGITPNPGTIGIYKLGHGKNW